MVSVASYCTDKFGDYLIMQFNKHYILPVWHRKLLQETKVHQNQSLDGTKYRCSLWLYHCLNGSMCFLYLWYICSQLKPLFEGKNEKHRYSSSCVAVSIIRKMATMQLGRGNRVSGNKRVLIPAPVIGGWLFFFLSGHSTFSANTI